MVEHGGVLGAVYKATRPDEVAALYDETGRYL